MREQIFTFYRCSLLAITELLVLSVLKELGVDASSRPKCPCACVCVLKMSLGD